MELCSPTEDFTVRLTEFRKIPCQLFAPQFKKNYGIELDLHLTRDGELVVFHDDDLKRVCGRPERPEDLTAAELTKCTLLGTKEHIPLFRDVLALVNDQVPLPCRVKNSGTKHADLPKSIRNATLLPRCISS